MKSQTPIFRTDKLPAHIQPASDDVPPPAEPRGERNPPVAGRNAIARNRAMPQPAMPEYKHLLSGESRAAAYQPQSPASRWKNSPPAPCRLARNQPATVAAGVQGEPRAPDQTLAPPLRQKSGR